MKRKVLAGHSIKEPAKNGHETSKSSTESLKTDKPKAAKKIKTNHQPKANLPHKPIRAKGKLAIKKAELQNMRGASKKEVVMAKDVEHLKAEIVSLKAENEKLKIENEDSKEKCKKLSAENEELQIFSMSKEAEIREEVVSVMQAQIRDLEEFYQERLRRPQPTPKSDAKQRRAEKFVEDLIDKVEECEEEMKRMKARHDEEVDEIMEVSCVYKKIILI